MKFLDINLQSKFHPESKWSNGACSVHEWEGKFLGQDVLFKMTSVCGHVMSLDFPEKYKSWGKVDPVELFSCPTEKKEANPKLRIPAHLSREAKGATYVVLWLDCDKEGENICFEVLDRIKPVLKRPAMKEQVIFRAKFSAITEIDILKAMDNLTEPNENESKSVDARKELDLRIGCAFTRFQTKFFRDKYRSSDSTLISYGPCQTPTLGLCVTRHDAIQNFIPEPFWVLQPIIEVSESCQLSLEWERIRSSDREAALEFQNLIQNEKKARVVSCSKKEKLKQRPLALNTVELMKVASSRLGMSPHHAMQIAEKLYSQGYISYPRTETTSYPDNFDLIEALKKLESSSHWGVEVRALLSAGICPPRNGQDAGDHPPITPMKLASKELLDSDSWNIYDYIVRHFIGSLSYDCKMMTTNIGFEIGSERFSCSGKTLVDAGYTAVMTWQMPKDEELVPMCAVGTTYDIKELKLLKRQTCAPVYLTESEVITLMEHHGIGTDASIPVHINNLEQRNYVTVGSGRRMVPTSLGIALVHGYQKIDPDLVLPTMRSAVEEQLTLIAKGKAEFEDVLKHNLELFRLKFLHFVKNISSMDQVSKDSFTSLSDMGKNFSRCEKCQRSMKLVGGKVTRLNCPQCKNLIERRYKTNRGTGRGRGHSSSRGSGLGRGQGSSRGGGRGRSQGSSRGGVRGRGQGASTAGGGTKGQRASTARGGAKGQSRGKSKPKDKVASSTAYGI
ncbi:DNA topoisomerase 3-beta-1-like isoform X2 [Artemia franciscana]|uniref:DNA topoisomerase 3-beta-1-like isoform X2 n=1 Tax=Artemia franciscana TaxID=6661 RepID=UPI0032DA7686